MKKILSIFLLFSMQQSSFGMDYLKSWFGYNNSESTLSKEERCLDELIQLK